MKIFMSLVISMAAVVQVAGAESLRQKATIERSVNASTCHFGPVRNTSSAYTVAADYNCLMEKDFRRKDLLKSGKSKYNEMGIVVREDIGEGFKNYYLTCVLRLKPESADITMMIHSFQFDSKGDVKRLNYEALVLGRQKEARECLAKLVRDSKMTFEVQAAVLTSRGTVNTGAR